MKFKKIIYSTSVVLGALALLGNSHVNASTPTIQTKAIASVEQTQLQWIDLGTHKNVDLNKTWTIRFSKAVSLSKIESVVVKTGNLFIPVQLTKNAQNAIQVTPTLGYTGNTNYEMQVFLSNGLKYKMTFTTKNAARQADKEPNNAYTGAQTIYVDDHVKGNVSRDDANDYYKVIVPADGKLDVTAISTNGVPLSVFLYNAYGSDKSPIQFKYNAITNHLSAGLEPGTYYIGVNNSKDTPYELKTAFTENSVENDVSGASYVDAQLIDINDEMTGHIGYTNDSGVTDDDDFLKVVLPENGMLTVDIRQLNGAELHTFVYGAFGTDKSPLAFEYDKVSKQYTLGLQAGTYYIGLNDNGHYGAYNVKTSFAPEEVANDQAASTYVTGPELALNKKVTGHLGHDSDNGGENEDDYYKVVVKEAGTLNVHVQQLQGRKLNVHLYGQYGPDRAPLDFKYDVAQHTLSSEVTPGTYYIRLNDAGNYGTYELVAEVVK